jgi:Lhr-like helicase
MLEYMLCRPRDDCFFGPDLRAIVLDEAHLYSGSLAAEITLLLRRVRDRCGVEPSRLLQILTSATLGGSESDLRRFAATLFSTSPEKVKLIEGRRAFFRLATVKAPPAKAPTPERLAQHSELDITTLTPTDEFAVVDDQDMDVLAQICLEVADVSTVAGERERHGNTPAPFLHSVLDKAPITQELAQVLYDRQIIALPELAEILWGQRSPKATEATTLFLRLAAAARPAATTMPLVPHRLHFLVRGPEGVSSCLNPDCTGPDENRLDPLGCVQASLDRCRFCNSATLPVHRCDNCGEWALSVFQDIQEGRLLPGYFVSARKRTFYLVSRDRTEGLASVVVDPATGQYSGSGFMGARLYKAPCPEHGATCNECARQKCPQCDAVWRYADNDTDADEREGVCVAFGGTDRLAISVLEETVLHGLPPYGDQSRSWKPGGGRRLLCFSDSRREAARLGPYLTAQHEIWLIRSALAGVLRANSTPELADWLEKDVTRLEKELQKDSLPQSVRVTVHKELGHRRGQLQAATVGLPFEQLAQLFAQNSAARQLLDPDLGEKHRADRWTQRDWEANERAVSGHAEALIAGELDGPKRSQVSLESMGLVEIAYPGLESTQPPTSMLGLLPSEPVRKALMSVWTDFVALLLDTLRSDRTIGWSEETPAREWQGESPLYALWSTRDQHGWSARAFVGDPRIPLHRRSLRLWFTRAVLTRAGCSEGEAEECAPGVLRHVFDQLVDMANQGEFNWLRCEERQIAVGSSQTGIQLLMDRLAFRTPAALHRCLDTDTLWSRSALDFVPFRGCHGRLVSVEKKALDEDLRWGRPRREVERQEIFHMGLWAEEHSAQLGPDENKRRQSLFKDGIRNILSSTTTMELGIDIGGLNGVLMGNVPPSRANHLQRAGRSGRRADGSAIVATFAREQAFDREVFHRFGDFLKRDLRRPVVFLDREEFAHRHTHAFLLGLFFSPRQESRVGAMDAYGQMGKFCGVTPPDRWTDDKKPFEPAPSVDYSRMFSAFLEALGADHSIAGQTKTIVSGTPLEEISKGLDAWDSFLNEAKRRFSEVVEDWRRDVNSLLDAWKEIPTEPSPDLVGSEPARANAVRYQIKARCDLTVIECLADGRFLPRYGFPINLQRLSVRVPKDETCPCGKDA